MFLQRFLLLQLVLASCAHNINMIRDYFLFKKVSRVVGFSCDDVESSYKVVRQLNGAGISTSIKSFRSNLDTAQLLNAEYWRIGIFIDLQCLTSEEVYTKSIFNKASAHKFYEHLHNWLILSRNITHAIEALNDTNFSITTDLVISLPIRDDKSDLYDVYNHCKHCGGSLTIAKFGTWQKDAGLKVLSIESKFIKRWNFQGILVKVAGIVVRRPNGTDLVEYLKTKSELVTDNWSKFGYSILVHVAEMFNMTFQYIELNHWPKNDSNGPQMLGLKKGLYDIGFYPSVMTRERLRLANIITQVWPSRTCFMFLTTPSAKMDMYIILRPFAASVWYMIILILILTIIILTITMKLENVLECDRGIATLIIVAALSQQGLPSFLNKSASRIAFIQIMIFGLLLFNYYSAAIVSSRLNAPLHKMNDSLTSLAKSKMKLAAEESVVFHFLMRNPTKDQEYFKKHWMATAGANRFRPLKEGLKQIIKGGFAYHVDPNNIYPTMEREFTNEMICQLTEVHLLKPSSVGLWAAPKSQFLEIAKIGLLRISSAGLRKRQVARWSARKPFCLNTNNHVTSVTIRESAPFMILLIFGISLSIVVCFVEIIVFRISRSREKKAVVAPSTKELRRNQQLSKFLPNKTIPNAEM